MNEKQLPLVTYEQAQRLKKAGFDWPTWWYYSEFYTPGRNPTHLGYDYCHNKSDFGGLSAPTVALALKWMRDEKGVIGNIFCRYEKRNEVYNNEVFVGDGWNESEDFNTYEAAESALLDKLIEFILQKDVRTEHDLEELEQAHIDND